MVFILLLIYIVGIFVCFVILRLIGNGKDNLVDVDIFISFVWPVTLILFVLAVVFLSPFYKLDKIIKKFKS